MFTQEVAHGVALLDLKRPGWRKAINIENLDISLGCLCVLGQIYGHFSKGLDEICPAQDGPGRRGFALAHGFDVPNMDYIDGLHEAYKALQAAWIAALVEGIC